MITSLNSQQLRDIFISAEKSVTAKREILNNLNVYPVPDGDTGINMSLTLKEIVDVIKDIKDDDLKSLSEKIAESSLMGARGNSGVILSQFIGGFCEVIQDQKEISPKILLKSFQKGTDEAYASVSNPVEGTILTIIRSATEEIERKKNLQDITSIIRSTINKSQETLRKTPDMLQKLKDAGVVDAGGAGFVYFLEGFYHVLKDDLSKDISATDDYSSPQLARAWDETFGIFGTGGLRSIIEFNYKALKFFVSNIWWLLSKGWIVIKMGRSILSIKQAARLIKTLANQLKWQNIKQTNIAILKLLQVWQEVPEEKYCYEVILKDSKLNIDQIKNKLSKIGTSIIVGQSGVNTKIHFHVNDKDKTRDILQSIGTITKEKIDDIHKQQKEFIGKKLDDDRDKGCEVITVINGNGFKEIYESFEGVATLDGGDTMNPSVSDFNKLLNKISANNIIILPNNKNIFLTASKVSSKSDKHIKVLKTTDQAQGLTALLNFNKKSNLNQNAQVMENALSTIKTFSITKATRKSTISGKTIQKDEFIALSNKKLISSHKNLEDTLKSAIKKELGELDLITLYSGENISKQEGDVLTRKLSLEFKKEFQHYHGDQPHYDYIVSIE